MEARIDILSGHCAERLGDVRVLFREYADALGFHLSFQDFEQELSELPGRYSPPQGAILLVECDGKLAGCVAMKKLAEEICEMKRFYVRAAFRGRGLGRRLAEAIIAAAREAGFRSMRLDTVPAMQSA